MEKRRNCSLGAISPLFHNIFYMLLDFHVKAGTRFSLRDKRLFEISEFEITRVDCIYVLKLDVLTSKLWYLEIPQQILAVSDS